MRLVKNLPGQPPSGAIVPSAPVGSPANVMWHWPRPGELSSQRPAMLTVGGGAVCGAALSDPGSAQSAQAAAAAGQRQLPSTGDDGGDGRCVACVGHFMVGMTNSAPSLVPDGQRAVTVLVLV